MDNIAIPINLSSQSKSGTVVFSNGGKGIVSLKVNWTSVSNSDNNTSTVTATMTLYASASGNVIGGSYLSVNGIKKDYSGLHLNKDHSGSQLHTLATITTVVPHNSDGSKTITIEGKLVWNGYMWNGGSATISSIYGSKSVELETIDIGTVPVSNCINTDKSGIIEGVVTSTLDYSCEKNRGTYNFQFRYSKNNGEWITSDWSAINEYAHNLTADQRGAKFSLSGRVRNDVGVSNWCPSKDVFANNVPNKPTDVAPSNNQPISSTNLQFHGNGDPDGQVTCYDIYMKKNNGKQEWIWGTRSNEMSVDYSVPYDTSKDPHGTKYQFMVSTCDILQTYIPGVYSEEFFKPYTLPSPNTTLSCKSKNGIGIGIASIKAECDTSNHNGQVYYQLSYKYEGIDWQSTGWETNNIFEINLDLASGKIWSFKTIAKDDAGLSEWSNIITIKSNTPPIPASNLSFSSEYSIDNVTLNWNPGSDIDGSVSYNVYISKNNTNNYELYKSTSNTSMVFSFNGDAEGTSYKFYVDTIDNLGAKTRSSSESNPFYKAIPPSIPIIKNSNQTIFENAFTIFWSSSNFNGVNGSYTINKKINNENWTLLCDNVISPNYKIDIPNLINRGDSIQLAIKSVNTIGQESNFVYSDVFKRNRIPNATSDIRPKNRYVEGVINFNWNEATDIDGQAVSYKLYISTNNGPKELIGTTFNTSYAWSIPSSNPENYTYRLGVESVDSLGATNIAWGPLFGEAIKPCYPTNLQPSSGIFENIVNLTWNEANFNNQEGNYIIKIYCNGIKVYEDTTKINSYTLNMDNIRISRGSMIKFSVQSINNLNQKSSEIFSGEFKRNQIPETPEIIYPKSGTIVYSKRPRIIIKLGQEFDGQDMSLNINIENAEYDSKNTPECFSVSKAKSGTVIDFMPNKDINTGSVYISCKANDGLCDSEQSSILIKSVIPVSKVKPGDSITSNSFNSVIEGQNNVMWSCGLTTTDVKTKKGEYVKSKIMNNIINNIVNAINKINSLIKHGKFNYNSNINNVEAGEPIQSSVINEITEIINNM